MKFTKFLIIKRSLVKELTGRSRTVWCNNNKPCYKEQTCQGREKEGSSLGRLVAKKSARLCKTQSSLEGTLINDTAKDLSNTKEVRRAQRAWLRFLHSVKEASTRCGVLRIEVVVLIILCESVYITTEEFMR